MGERYDFSGYATRNNIRCSDGRTIRRDAFKDCDGQTVPLVWQHVHDDPFNVLGHAVLENRDDGVYTYCKFNDTESGRNAKLLVQHGDIKALSIYANRLKQNGGDVIHGVIREVSLVLAGANPGAFIESLDLEHSDDDEPFDDGEAVMYFDCGLEMSHADEESKDKTSDKGEETMATDKKEKTVKDVFDTLTEEQKTVVYALVGQAIEDAKGEINDEDNDEEDEKEMKHSVFNQDECFTGDNFVLSHEDQDVIWRDARACGSFRESLLAHAEDFGITNLDYMFPDYQNVTKEPELIKKEDEWVTEIMNGVSKLPFSKVRYIGADITADEARARGYLKGNRKMEQVYSLTKRTTDPTTVYAKQKFHKDDLTDLARNWNAVPWTQKMMRTLWDFEVARAILVGDGRSSGSEDKIDETKIRPIWTDDSFFSYNYVLEFAASDTASEKADAIIDGMVRARKEYRGSGNLVFFTTEDWIDEMILLKDNIGHRLYKTEAELAAAMRVKKLVPVTEIENLTRTVGGDTHTLIGIAVDLGDYSVGADDGGKLSNYDQFDIDYNSQKFLLEGRCSGALTKFHSAIVVESKPAN